MSRDLAAASGVSIPLHGAEHSYILRKPSRDCRRDLPVMINTDEWRLLQRGRRKAVGRSVEPVAKLGSRGHLKRFLFSIRFHSTLGSSRRSRKGDQAAYPSLDKPAVTFLYWTGELHPRHIYLLGETRKSTSFLRVRASLPQASCLPAGWQGVGVLDRRSHPRWICLTLNIKRTQPFQASRKFLHDRTKECLAFSTRCTGRTGSSTPRGMFGGARFTTSCWLKAHS